MLISHSGRKFRKQFTLGKFWIKVIYSYHLYGCKWTSLLNMHLELSSSV